MTVKQTIMTFAVTTMMMMGMATTANADAVDKTAEIANETTQVANYAKDKVNKDGLIETIDKNRGNIEELVNKGGKLAYSFGNKLDEAVSYTKETENKNIFAKTSNFVSILFTDKTKEQVLNQDKSIVETAKEQVANDDLKVSTKQAIKYQFSRSGFSSIPSGFSGFLAVGIRILLGIIIISTIAIKLFKSKRNNNNNGDIKSKNAKIDRAYDKGQNLLSRIR
ncbi:hypothetical protein FJB45_002462 [Enterococcus faecium]|uniref:hypothetical protein n=1 Tax=Enterococcus faecalis TaxID=1351 RepID=UPI0019F9F0EC|nr:hypothetical protein [Enterococcus faecium]